MLPHYVAVWMQSSADITLSFEHFPDHRKYYEQIGKPNQTMFYSRISGNPGLFLVLAVCSEEDFRKIIRDDPAVKAGILNIINTVSFREPVWFS